MRRLLLCLLLLSACKKEEPAPAPPPAPAPAPAPPPAATPAVLPPTSNAPAASSTVTDYQALADEACACKDLDCLARAARHGEEVMKTHVGARGTEADARAIKEAGDKLQACTTRLMEDAAKQK